MKFSFQASSSCQKLQKYLRLLPKYRYDQNCSWFAFISNFRKYSTTYHKQTIKKLCILNKKNQINVLISILTKFSLSYCYFFLTFFFVKCISKNCTKKCDLANTAMSVCPFYVVMALIFIIKINKWKMRNILVLEGSLTEMKVRFCECLTKKNFR